MVCCRIPNCDRSTVLCIQINAIVCCIDNRVETVVESCLCHGCNIFARIEEFHFRLTWIELCGKVCWEVHSHLVTLLSLLRRYDDNTVWSSWTIDRSRGCIFQHLHTLDIISVESVQCHVCRYTIYNIKRILWRVERTNTTDTYLTATNRRTVGCNGHTGNSSLQGTHRVCVRRWFQILCRNDRYRTRQVGFLLGCIARYDNFVQVVGKFSQFYFHVWLYFNFHCLVADIRYDKSCSLVSIKHEVTVKVCYSSRLRSFFHYGCSDYCFTSFVCNHTAHFNFLCVGSNAHRQKWEANQYFW